MENIIMKVKDIDRSYPLPEGELFYALRHITMDIPRAKLTVLKGRSGSGKTTLLNLLGALDKPDKGQILWDGRDITAMNEEERGKIRRLEMGFIFQSVALIPVMTAGENVEYALRLAGYGDDYTARTRECLKMVGLESRMQHMPQELSGGEQQRVAIARAIAHNPKVLFADEPTAELDTGTGLQVVRIFKELVEKEGVSVIMTTHDAGLMEVADQVFELEDGELTDG